MDRLTDKRDKENLINHLNYTYLSIFSSFSSPSCCCRRSGTLATVPDGRHHGSYSPGEEGWSGDGQGGRHRLTTSKEYSHTHIHTLIHAHSHTYTHGEGEDNQQTANSPRSEGSLNSSLTPPLIRQS